MVCLSLMEKRTPAQPPRKVKLFRARLVPRRQFLLDRIEASAELSTALTALAYIKPRGASTSTSGNSACSSMLNFDVSLPSPKYQALKPFSWPVSDRAVPAVLLYHSLECGFAPCDSDQSLDC